MWAAKVPEEQWNVFLPAIRAARKHNTPVALGGAFAMAAYIGEFKGTKDLDLYVLPEDKDRMISALTELGMKDLYEEQSYDRRWIYRSTGSGAIIDIIWAMANMTATVDRQWLERGLEIRVRGETMRVLPPEELIWTKLYVLQRDRCDWPDILNILYATSSGLDWNRLLDRIGDDWPLLAGVLSVFGWMFPCRAIELPQWVRDALRLPHLAPAPEKTSEARVNKLDSRNWFRQHIQEQPC